MPRIVLFWMLLGAVTSFADVSPTYITFPSDIDWVARDSEHFHVLYRRGEDRLAEKTLVAAEKAHKLLSGIFEEIPPSTWIVLADFRDSLNGYAIDYPYPHFVVFTSPPEPSGALAYLDKWLESVVLHEFTHVVHLYPAHGMWAFLRSIFGRLILPNGLMPSHLHEGLATFMETRFTDGGRGKGPQFPMYRRMAVKEGVWGADFVPLDLLEGSSIRWPGGTAPYFFGYYLYEELWSRKQAPGLRAFIRNMSAATWPYFINVPLEKTYDTDYPTLWKDVYDKTRVVAQKEIEAIEKRPLSELKYITDNHFTKWDVALSPDTKLVAYRSSHPETGTTVQIHPAEGTTEDDSFFVPGREEGLCWIQHEGRQKLVFTGSNSYMGFSSNGYSFNLLKVYDAEQKETTSPTRGSDPIARVHNLACGTDSVFTYQESKGEGVVREWDFSDLERWKYRREWAVPEGEWVTAIVAGKTTLIAVRRPQSTAIYLWPENGVPEKKWEVAGHFYDFGKPLPSGEWPAIGSPSGREEVWALNLEKRTARKRVSVLGGLDSFDRIGDKWWVSSYRHGGYDIAEAKPIPEDAEVRTDLTFTEKKVGKENRTGFEVAAQDGETETVLKGHPTNPSENEPSLLGKSASDKPIKISPQKEYSPFPSIWPTAWIPSALIVPNGLQVSAWIPGFDVSQRHLYNIFAGYDTRGSPFVTAAYTYRFGLSQSVGAEIDYLPSYLIASREFLKQWSVTANWGVNFGRFQPQITLGPIFRRMESSNLGPAIQSAGVSVGLSYTPYTVLPPQNIAPTYQTSLSVSHSQYFQALGSQDNFFATMVSLDQWIRSPWTPKHVFKISGRLGFTQGTIYYNSYFQGGGELMVSPGRPQFLNRGFLPGTFFSQRLLTTNFDYLFPITRIERGWGQWPFFLKRMNGSIVADITTLGYFQKYYWSVGAELRTYWKLFYYLPTEIRLGGYHGFGPYGESFYGIMAFEASFP